ncbi:hypothetical protein QR685DRAFT_283238 [Neurospora intermedia]|uniref:Uncharacterized protein n=1 Tax=Neurospora intermedia TaxID=5142 RepID=A0ABR3D9F2_NEUIN
MCQCWAGWCSIARYMSGGPSLAAVLASPPRPAVQPAPRPAAQPAPALKQAPLTQFGVTGATFSHRGKKPKILVSAHNRPIAFYPSRPDRAMTLSPPPLILPLLFPAFLLSSAGSPPRRRLPLLFSSTSPLSLLPPPGLVFEEASSAG